MAVHSALWAVCHAVLAACISQLRVHADVAMVYTIQRHGAREILPKTAQLEESPALGGPSLLPQGERACYDAGRAFRARYLLPSCSATSSCLTRLANPSYGAVYASSGRDDVGRGFHNLNTFVRASWTDRASVSAQAFFAGVFPDDPAGVTPTTHLPTGDHLVPIYNPAPDEEDFLLRGYTKCDAYQQRVAAWLQSEEFRAKERDTAGLREQVAEAVRGVVAGQPGRAPVDARLEAWWNVFDAFDVARTSGGAALAMPQLPAATMQQVEDLASWLEVAKMRSNLTGTLLGAPLLGDILKFMGRAQAAQLSGNGFYKLLSVSAHYNTLMGVLSALSLDQHPPARASLPWLTATFPRPSSLLAFELHVAPTNKADVAVRLVAQDGPAAPYMAVPLPCASGGDAAEALAGRGACTYGRFREWVAPLSVSTALEWCTACQAQGSSLCRREAAAPSGQPSTAAPWAAPAAAPTAAPTAVPTAAGPAAGCATGGGEGWTPRQAGTLAGAVVATFVGTLLVCAAVFGLLYRRLKRDAYNAAATRHAPELVTNNMAYSGKAEAPAHWG